MKARVGLSEVLKTGHLEDFPILVEKDLNPVA